ncbi:MAG: bifunctional riboflavin kinase/FAD synthetase [Clostridiales bacterium]|nr:bifunctional riboflavin kinase/FAD synthetase [Clostridiales bacterium]
MKIITVRDLPFEGECVVSIGNFDGVHLGHASLLEKASEIAKENKLPMVVFTFEDTPKNNRSKHITRSSDKLRLLEVHGADGVYFEDFDACRNMTPREFIKSTLIDRFNANTVVCGYDYRFGVNRSGDAGVLFRILEEYGRKTVIIPPVKVNGVVISSTLIRQYIKDGEINKASELLGRRYSFNLPVVEGRHIGRRIGFPTINQRFPEYQLVPAYGVYACLCEIGGVFYKGVSNIGVKPTVSDTNEVICETHILDFNEDMYRRDVRIFLFSKLRDEKKFDSLEELKNAVANDVRMTKNYFSANL